MKSMMTQISKIILFSYVFALVSSVFQTSMRIWPPQVSSTYSNLLPDSFLQCISERYPSNISTLNVLYLPSNSSYQPILESTAQNSRFLNRHKQKPLAIVTPLSYSQVQSAVICSRENGLQIRVRSGGHDYEGYSYTSGIPNVSFILIDLSNLRSVNVDVENKSAWVESGATLGQLYYWIANRSSTHGFPAGDCPTVGVGGHIRGGGTGYLIRKYGVAADNVIDALIIDANGRILDKELMGNDLFWAIRGGGAENFGIVVAWKLKLVDVPPLVTVFTLTKTLEQGAIDLFHKWQYVAYKMNEDLILRLFIITEGMGTNKKTQAIFKSLFLGSTDDLLALMDENFPELGLRKDDCIEMSWIESIIYCSDYPAGETIDALRDIKPLPKSHFKAKSDFVDEPLNHTTIMEFWKWCSEKSNLTISMHPYGGRMEDVSESEIPFPHRKGILYDIYYRLNWEEMDDAVSRANIDWMRKLYELMSPFVSKTPRRAYLNIRDHDLGANAAEWGVKYFKNNFKLLAMLKCKYDPENFFWYEQSIPPLCLDGQRGIE